MDLCKFTLKFLPVGFSDGLSSFGTDAEISAIKFFNFNNFEPRYVISSITDKQTLDQKDNIELNDIMKKDFIKDFRLFKVHTLPISTYVQVSYEQNRYQGKILDVSAIIIGLRKLTIQYLVEDPSGNQALIYDNYITKL